MEDYRKLWADCLAMIRERIANEEVYKVWFGKIVFEQYDPQRRSLLLQLPSDYVYYYLEQHHTPLLREVTQIVFKANISLSYRILKDQPITAYVDSSQIIDQMAKRGFNLSPKLPQMRIKNAAQRMRDCLQQALGDQYRWLPVYDKIVAWLTDNKGRGLLCIGANNTGKTVLCTRILPLFLGFENVAVCSAIDMTAHSGKVARIDELLKSKVIVIDGLGTEGQEVNHYGRIRRPLIELCDTAEQQGKLLILTTSCLSTTPMSDDCPWKRQFPTSIGEYYGDHTLSVLRRITTTAMFNESPVGEDMRH